MFLLIFYILVALFFSFLCSIAEAVLLSVTRAYVLSLEKEGRRSGQLLRRLKEDVNRPLAAILSLNTIAHTVGAVGAGAQAAFVFGNKYVGLASAVLTLMILVFSEIIPKTIGAHYWRKLAPFIARPLQYLIWILYPFVLLSEKLTFSEGEGLKGFSREEFAVMADLGAKEGQLAMQESRILKNLLLFRSTKISSIMTPRTVVFSLPESMTISEFFEKYPQIPYSRIPVYHKNIDDITGFVLKIDILLAQARDQYTSELTELKREIKAVPGKMSIFDLYEFFLDQREHIVIVVDKYGGLEGIVTLEDVIETLLGLEIVDEADKTVDMQGLARKLWEERAKKMGIEIEQLKAETQMKLSIRNEPKNSEPKNG